MEKEFLLRSILFLSSILHKEIFLENKVNSNPAKIYKYGLFSSHHLQVVKNEIDFKKEFYGYVKIKNVLKINSDGFKKRNNDKTIIINISHNDSMIRMGFVFVDKLVVYFFHEGDQNAQHFCYKITFEEVDDKESFDKAHCIEFKFYDDSFFGYNGLKNINRNRRMLIESHKDNTKIFVQSFEMVEEDTFDLIIYNEDSGNRYFYELEVKESILSILKEEINIKFWDDLNQFLSSLSIDKLHLLHKMFTSGNVFYVYYAQKNLKEFFNLVGEYPKIQKILLLHLKLGRCLIDSIEIGNLDRNSCVSDENESSGDPVTDLKERIKQARFPKKPTFIKKEIPNLNKEKPPSKPATYSQIVKATNFANQRNLKRTFHTYKMKTALSEELLHNTNLKTMSIVEKQNLYRTKIVSPLFLFYKSIALEVLEKQHLLSFTEKLTPKMEIKEKWGYISLKSKQYYSLDAYKKKIKEQKRNLYILEDTGKITKIPLRKKTGTCTSCVTISYLYFKQMKYHKYKPLNMPIAPKQKYVFLKTDEWKNYYLDYSDCVITFIKEIQNISAFYARITTIRRSYLISLDLSLFLSYAYTIAITKEMWDHILLAIFLLFDRIKKIDYKKYICNREDEGLNVLSSMVADIERSMINIKDYPLERCRDTTRFFIFFDCLISRKINENIKYNFKKEKISTTIEKWAEDKFIQKLCEKIDEYNVFPETFLAHLENALMVTINSN